MVAPEEAIDRINGVFGRHEGSRALHAKGAFYTGTFTATPWSGEHCRALHLQGDPVPVWVRWSNGRGRPRNSDKGADVRGMAVSFRLPDGTATDATLLLANENEQTVRVTLRGLTGAVRVGEIGAEAMPK